VTSDERRKGVSNEIIDASKRRHLVGRRDGRGIERQAELEREERREEKRRAKRSQAPSSGG